MTPRRDRQLDDAFEAVMAEVKAILAEPGHPAPQRRESDTQFDHDTERLDGWSK